MKNISIQGFEGSFHQIAAQQYFGSEIEVLPCSTFREVTDRVKSKEADAGVMAIENSIAGSILPNYNLLLKSNLKIIGEVYLPIQQHLMVNPGVEIMDIREVQSHPMAIQQCLDYLLQHNWKLVETEDTALSAKKVHQERKRHSAVIAGELAAEMYDLEIIARNIHTEKKNYTRFLVLERKAKDAENADKASVIFKTDHSKGSLAKVLTRIADGGINLSKLQSFPIPASAWKYNFLADMEFESTSQFNEVIQNLQSITDEIKVLGVYKNGNSKSVK